MEYLTEILDFIKSVDYYKLVTILVFILILVLVFVKPLKEWLRKKLGLYTEAEVKSLANFITYPKFKGNAVAHEQLIESWKKWKSDKNNQ